MGLERTFYISSEDEGAVEVCAVVITPAVSCPIEFPFTVTFSATSTGKSSTVGSSMCVSVHTAIYKWSSTRSYTCACISDCHYIDSR